MARSSSTMAMVFFTGSKSKRPDPPLCAQATFRHFRSAERHQVITVRTVAAREMVLEAQHEDAAMTNQSRTYVTEQFASQPGERWRRFLERVGTRSNDFGTRLARARFV